MSTSASSADEWRRGWPTVLAAMVGMSFYSVITYSLGTFIGPIEREFGWSRASISGGLTIFAGISTLGGPFVGMLLDRVGTRRLAIGSMLLSAGTFAAFGTATAALGTWFALYVAYGVFALGIKSTVWSAGVSSVFTRSRSLALALMLSGSALAQTLAPIAANWLIAHHGWRAAYVWLGTGWGGLALVLLLFFYRDARARRAAEPGPTPLLPGLTFREALRDTRVIRIAAANLLMSLVGAGVTVHLVRVIVETGTTMNEAVGVAATAGIAGIAGKLLVGWLLDRIQGSLVPVGGFAVGALGYLLLLDPLELGIPALTAGTMCLGFAAGAGLQISTYLISRYAGLRHFGAVFGTISSMMMAGTAAGPLIAGAVHDATGSYDALLWTAVPIMLGCALLFLRLGPYPEFAEAAPADEG
ncbi:MFS transporter [Novosphingobium soli]|uniref:MFS transporter n=1 Tax=Novosphingobium soli TaxID=574956 RepID=A0ABV6CW05_9SPHN